MSRTRTILLLTGDYAERLNALYAAAQAAAQDKTPLALTDADPYEQLRAEYDEVKAEAEAAGTRVVLASVTRGAWRELRAAHPPRTVGDDDVVRADRIAGVNLDTVEDDLVYASLAEPEFTSRAAYDEWANSLAAGDFQTILMAAWELTNGSKTDPKSLPASPTPSSDSN